MSQAELYVYSTNDYETSLEAYQLRKANELLLFAAQFNDFYKVKLKDTHLPIRTMAEFRQIPFTHKSELVQDQQNRPPYGANHSYPQASYVRYHQTSGTTGRPLRILDTKESWEWWTDCWVEVLRSALVTKEDRVFLAFSFGPFIGFWAAYEGAKKLGALVIPGGGQNSLERLTSILSNQATVLLCTPSYALHLAEVAAKEGLDIKNSQIRCLIHAGEPGASIPAVREAIESAWGAKCYDHAGMTEMGAYAFSCVEQGGLHVNERQFLAEVIHPQTHQPVPLGQMGELVLTNFGRYGYPLIRYRTGDMVVNASEPCRCGNRFRFFPGGLVGRSDDMVVVRGVNIFPQSLEAIIREFKEVAEFRIVYYSHQELLQVKVQLEATSEVASRLQVKLRERLGLRIEVETVAPGVLPRFEMKARRVLDLRNGQKAFGV
ncbi:phenylacetate--CoA ligase family protein [Sulfoacidibacillus thermotolerans]|uniref:Phenylacetate--CoA ligase n=1 Tax=Sulfoacidibacillus thermotolerans TaxID=1765684 RepID=A0A2U3D765_SULT2|nr:AMP-binding protein [Sulfoacidibacillus thermotolerans]PWI57129.1 phenylacetate--CoA ligase [Sulfoacidibacillus thermotolerans]